MDDMLITGKLLKDLLVEWAGKSPYTSKGLMLDLNTPHALDAVTDAVRSSIRDYMAGRGIKGIGISIAFQDDRMVFDTGAGQLVSRDYITVTIHHEGLTTSLTIGGGDTGVKLDMDGDAR
ncbi:MAG: hypothetical protein CL583_13215 [Alteromonadaceae bacterium]|nr:hypothetical protein [Alteromonadaceae bacterium]|tara:strand:- start:242 stop:601 length:360 start_codon:yes stop_codon:yes gene_type:complete